MYKFEISAEAEEDLEEIMLYKSGYSPTYAITFIDGLANRFKKTLSAFPSSGVIYSEDKNIRKITFEEFTAFYTVREEQETVYILRIIDQEKPLEARGIKF